VEQRLQPEEAQKQGLFRLPSPFPLSLTLSPTAFQLNFTNLCHAASHEDLIERAMILYGAQGNGNMSVNGIVILVLAWMIEVIAKTCRSAIPWKHDVGAQQGSGRLAADMTTLWLFAIHLSMHGIIAVARESLFCSIWLRAWLTERLCLMTQLFD